MTAPQDFRLEAIDLYKHYGDRTVVRGVSLEVTPGEVVGLLGPNGAGKTTTFYMVVGVEAPDKGEIRWCGTSINAMPMHRRARRGIGYLPQEASVFRGLTVWENLMALAELQDLSRSEQEERCEKLLTEFHLQKVRETLGMSLSGGGTTQVRDGPCPRDPAEDHASRRTFRRCRSEVRHRDPGAHR